MNLKKICLLPGDTDLANVDLIYVQEGEKEKNNKHCTFHRHQLCSGTPSYPEKPAEQMVQIPQAEMNGLP